MEDMMFKQMVLCLGVLFGAVGTARADLVTNMSQITTWVGSGSNEAAFEVEWQTASGPEAFVWGYRWNGTATGEDMLRAIAASNTGLFANIGSFGDLGYAVFGIGFDANGNGQFGVSPSLTFVNGIATGVGTANVVETRTATDPGDLYQEGWFSTGFWAYYIKQGSGDWALSNLGMSSQVLTNGEWDGWSFAVNFNSTAPITPSNLPVISVPEPSGMAAALAGLPGVLSLVAFARRKRAA